MVTIAAMSGAGTSRGDRRIANLFAVFLNAMIILLMLAVAAALWTVTAGVVHVASDREWSAGYSATVPAFVSALMVMVFEERRRRRRAGSAR